MQYGSADRVQHASACELLNAAIGVKITMFPIGVSGRRSRTYRRPDDYQFAGAGRCAADRGGPGRGSASCSDGSPACRPRIGARAGSSRPDFDAGHPTRCFCPRARRSDHPATSRRDRRHHGYALRAGATTSETRRRFRCARATLAGISAEIRRKRDREMVDQNRWARRPSDSHWQQARGTVAELRYLQLRCEDCFGSFAPISRLSHSWSTSASLRKRILTVGLATTGSLVERSTPTRFTLPAGSCPASPTNPNRPLPGK